MKRILLGTTALALAVALGAGQASAADKLSVGVGGFMEQWIGVANRDDNSGVDGGADIQSDSEIYFTGKMDSDLGIQFGVRVQLEANNAGSSGAAIDESNAWMSGEFGRVEFGARDPIHTRMHYAAAFGAGVGLNAGDTQKWIPGAYLETAGWTIPGDDPTLSYISPRVSGIQVGVSYTADSTSENDVASAPTDNDDAAVAAAVNFIETVGDMAVKFSLGHIAVSNSGSTSKTLAPADAADDPVTFIKGFDDKSYTNAGLSVGMGAFSLGLSYASRDDGGYMLVDDGAGGLMPVEDGSGQHDTVAVGLGYSDGPMSLSVGHMNRDAENGEERTATMVSMGYTLAPGVSWKTSIFGVEDSTRSAKKTMDADGTAFVTGIDIDF